VSAPVQTVEGLRHVQDQDVELEHGIRNDKVKNVDILTSGHKTPSVECCLVNILSRSSDGGVERNGKRKERGLTFNVSTAVGIVFRVSPREVRGDGDCSEDDQTELWVSIGLASTGRYVE